MEVTEAADAREPAELEQLHADVLESVLQRLGAVEASRLRPISRRMRAAVDDVAAWRLLRLEARSASQIERAAAGFAQPPRIKLAACARLDLAVKRDEDNPEARDRCHSAIAALVSACSASSGGLGGISVTGDFGDAFDARLHSSMQNINTLLLAPIGPDPLASELEHLLRSMLQPLGASRADGGSAHSLGSVSVRVNLKRKREDKLPHAAPAYVLPVQGLSCFKRLRRLAVPHVLDGETAASLATALPALRSISARLRDGAGEPLADLASHPALEELAVSFAVGPMTRPSAGFARFAEGPAALRLRKLKIAFGSVSDFRVAELPALARLTSLEELDLAVALHGAWSESDGSRAEEIDLNAPLEGLSKLRKLTLAVSLTQCGTGDLDRSQPLDGTLAALAAFLRLRKLKLFDGYSGPAPRAWLLQGGRGALAALSGLRSLRELDLSFGIYPRLGAADLRGLGGALAALRAHSHIAAKLHFVPLDEPGTGAALAELIQAAGPVLVELKVGGVTLRGDA